MDSNWGRLPFGRPRDIADPTHPSLPRIAMIASFNIKEYGSNMAPSGDSYLEIAEKVLLAARRPLSTRELLNEAYLRDIVPPHLHGRTQFKTFGARLSEDILRFKDKSRFYRAQPGRFFLTQLLRDSSIPLEFRRPITAKRRTRELKTHDVLCLPKAMLQQAGAASGKCVSPAVMRDLLDPHVVQYALDVDSVSDDCLPVAAFVIVMRNTLALSYRVGRYRESRDGFTEKRSIGFTTYVSKHDNSLFDGADHGSARAGLAAMATDLDLPTGRDGFALNASSELLFFVEPVGEGMSSTMLAVVKFEVSDEFEPFTKRLAINDLHWEDIERGINNIDDFDPWSKHIICHQREQLLGNIGGGSAKILQHRGRALPPESDSFGRYNGHTKGTALAL